MNSLSEFSRILTEQSNIKEEKIKYYIEKLKLSEIDNIKIDEVKLTKLWNLMNTINRFQDPWNINHIITYEEIDARINELKLAKLELSKILNLIY